MDSTVTHCVAEQVRYLKLPADLSSELINAASQIAGSCSLRENLDQILAALAEGAPLPEPGHPLAEAVAALLTLPEAREGHVKRGVDEAVSRATFADFSRWCEDYRAKKGQWGFKELNWFRRHLRGTLYHLGRLQYDIAQFRLPYRIYEHRNTRKVIALAAKEISCDAEGIPSRAASGFNTVWNDSDQQITANPVELKTGQILARPVTFLKSALQELLAPNDPILEIHIPAGAPLEMPATIASIREAARFFGDKFSAHPWRAMTCESWLLDPALDQLVGSSSNIRGFASLFQRLLSVDADGKQIIERVFPPGVDPLTYPATSSLQRKVSEDLRNGRRFRTTCGFVLRTGIDERLSS